MGLETNKLASLWKDRAVVEINVAVLHSFQVSQWVWYLETLWILCFFISLTTTALYKDSASANTQCTGGYKYNSNVLIICLCLGKQGNVNALLLPEKNSDRGEREKKTKRKLKARLFILLAQMSKCQYLHKAMEFMYFIHNYSLFKVSWHYERWVKMKHRLFSMHSQCWKGKMLMLKINKKMT